MDICAANNQFTVDLLREISRNTADQNVVFASFNIFTALAMVYLGARDDTAEQMENVLHIDDDDGDIHSKFRTLLSQITKNGHDYTLINFAKLFGEKTYNFLPSFLEAINASYGATLEEVDFHNNPEATRQNINKWITEQTKGKIENLLPEGSINSNTALVIANTLYFIANWTKQFPERSTRKAPFTLKTNKQVQVDMMITKNTFNIKHVENPGLTVLELPYGVSEDLSMIIMLPDNNTVLEQVDELISYDKLTQWTSRGEMRLTNVEIHLPRFQTVQSFSLRDVLSSLGMSKAFSQTSANFSGISEQNNLFVSEMYHKTFLVVNEKGTEAASASAAVMSIRSLTRRKFKADHPFHYFIRHNKSQCILLYGKLYQP
ncbi:serpin B10-like [Rhinophrynus dorsalis]